MSAAKAFPSDRQVDTLTLWAEWAWAITRLDKGLVGVENRTWAPWAALTPGSMLGIHAGACIAGVVRKAWTATDLRAHLAFMFDTARAAGWRVTPGERDRPDMIAVFHGNTPRTLGVVVPMRISELHTGRLVGVARFDGAQRNTEAPGTPWAVDYTGMFGWRLREASRFVDPLPMPGRQGLWRATIPAGTRMVAPFDAPRIGGA